MYRYSKKTYSYGESATKPLNLISRGTLRDYRKWSMCLQDAYNN